MKSTLFSVIALLVAFQIHSQNPISLKDSLEIMKVMKIQEIAWNNGDIDAFMEGYLKSDELVFSGKSGPVYGWDNTKKRYYISYPNTQVMGKLKFTVKKIRSISLNSAFLIGEYYLKRTTQDSYGHFTLLWKKVNNNWLIISDHTSAVK
jgi:ketosteroid isomerase-like protein|tara:strand:+ start:223 stop:669 length:447 start_codon:yes stop_codon:yes gene_type:complete